MSLRPRDISEVSVRRQHLRDERAQRAAKVVSRQQDRNVTHCSRRLYTVPGGAAAAETAAFPRTTAL